MARRAAKRRSKKTSEPSRLRKILTLGLSGRKKGKGGGRSKSRAKRKSRKG